MKITFATEDLHHVFTMNKIACRAITELKQDIIGGKTPGTPGPDTLKKDGTLV